jgi:hypothetical protein
MPLFLDKRCLDEREGQFFYVIRLRASRRLLLCCEACESRWSHPDMIAERDRVAKSPYEPLSLDDWEYAEWADLESAGWNKNTFRSAKWTWADET